MAFSLNDFAQVSKFSIFLDCNLGLFWPSLTFFCSSPLLLSAFDSLHSFTLSFPVFFDPFFSNLIIFKLFASDFSFPFLSNSHTPYLLPPPQLMFPGSRGAPVSSSPPPSTEWRSRELSWQRDTSLSWRPSVKSTASCSPPLTSGGVSLTRWETLSFQPFSLASLDCGGQEENLNQIKTKIQKIQKPL